MTHQTRYLKRRGRMFHYVDNYVSESPGLITVHVRAFTSTELIHILCQKPVDPRVLDASGCANQRP